MKSSAIGLHVFPTGCIPVLSETPPSNEFKRLNSTSMDGQQRAIDLHTHDQLEG